jgi:hypothetical protein
VLLEQHRGQLARAVDVELAAGGGVDAPFEPLQVGAHLARKPGEELAVDRDARPLHVHQHLGQRHLDIVEQGCERHLHELRREELVERQHRGAVVAAIGGRLGHHHFGKRDLRLPLAGEIGVGPHHAAQVLEAEGVDGVRAAAGIEHEAREHRVIADAAELDAGAAENLPVVLDVVARLRHRGVAEELRDRGAGGVGDRRQVGHGIRRRERAAARAVSEWQVPDLGRTRGQRQADELRVVGLERGGFGVEGHKRSLAKPGGEGGKFGRVVEDLHGCSSGSAGQRVRWALRDGGLRAHEVS